MAIVRPALLLAPSTYLLDVRSRQREEGIQAAVANHDTGALYNGIVRLLDRQGISNAAAISFAERHGSGKPASASVKANKSLNKSADGTGDRVSASTLNEGDTPCGAFYFWPGKITVGRCYDLRVKILDDDGEMTNFDLLEASPSSAR